MLIEERYHRHPDCRQLPAGAMDEKRSQTSVPISRRTFVGMAATATLTACHGKFRQNLSAIRYGVLLQRFRGRTLFAERDTLPFPAASVSKLLIAISVLRLFPDALHSASAYAIVRQSAFFATNRFFPNVISGSPIPLQTLLRLMIIQSDDFSANILVDHVGLRNINEAARDLGLHTLRVHGLFYDTSAPVQARGYTTATDCNKMLGYILRMATSDGARSTDYKQLVSCMLRQTDRRFIPEAVWPGMAVADKTGEVHDQLNDCAIIDPFGKMPILFTVLAHGSFSVFQNDGRYEAAVSAVQIHTRTIFRSLLNRELSTITSRASVI